MRLFSSSLFRRKDVSHLISEMNSGERLDRRLGPVALMGLGIGATIGTGLYVQTGFVAKEFAGPSLMLSFLIAAVGCGFAALCYSELASMVPVAGSAYTYAYTTMGELVAWIIGWDLILEYAIGSSVVAAGWSNHLEALLRNVFHVRIDPRLTSAPWDFDVEKGKFFLQTVTLDNGQICQAWFNLPAIAITAAITVVLVIGIKESAGFNAAMVMLNIAVIFAILGIGAAYLDPKNWHPFLHEEKGVKGIAEGAGRIFFAYIGFDSISTHAEEARRPQRDLAIGIMGAHGDGPLSPDRHRCAAFGRTSWTRADVCQRAGDARDPGGHDELAPGREPQPAAHSDGDGARRAAAAKNVRCRSSAVQDALDRHDHRRPGRGGRRGLRSPDLSCGPGQHRHLVRLYYRFRGGLVAED
jgi:Amino acid permease